jgi:hypothetical protein
MLLLLVIALALFAAPPTASAFDRFEVATDLDYGRNYSTAVDRLGVFVSNRPGGLYMGRLFTGDAFSSDGPPYISLKGETYYRARALGDVLECGWVGPSGKVDNDQAWALAAGTSQSGCDPSVLSWLGTNTRVSFNDGSALYSHVNCPPPSTEDNESLGTFGGLTYTTKPTAVYYNVDWNWDGVQYDATTPRDQAGEIPAGTAVFYRYTTKSGRFANVFFDGNSGSYGWAFIDRAAVTPVDYWSPASDPPNYRAFHCNSRVAPAAEVRKPWLLWLAVGGENFGPTA